jgi:hypothetical protein
LQQLVGLNYARFQRWRDKETLLSIAVSDTLLIVLRVDHQDFQATVLDRGRGSSARLLTLADPNHSVPEVSRRAAAHIG